MERKHLIIIGALLIIIFVLCVGIFSVPTHIEYENISVVPNGTSMEVPTNNLTNYSDVPKEGFKIWKFEQGSITSFNTKEVKARFHGTNLHSEQGLEEFKEFTNIIHKNFDNKEQIDGYYVYTINSEKFGDDDAKTMYAIIGGGTDTGDNIIIMTDNKDITLHIAKSVDLKMGDLTIYKANYTEWTEVDLNDLPTSYDPITKAYYIDT